MQYKTHLSTSLAISIPIMAIGNVSGSNFIFGICGICLGSLLPDIDEPESWIGRRTPIVSNIIKHLFGHRGITHSLVALGIVIIICTALFSPLSLGIVGGYFLHIAEDNFSISGVKWLIPFSKKTFKFNTKWITYKTGGIKEYVIFILTLILILIEYYNLNIKFTIL